MSVRSVRFGRVVLTQLALATIDVLGVALLWALIALILRLIPQ
jgi:hypothetical protein